MNFLLLSFRSTSSFSFKADSQQEICSDKEDPSRESPISAFSRPRDLDNFLKRFHRPSKLIRLITTPVRIIGKVRDLYVRSITSCADSGNYGHAVGYHGVDSVAYPRSFSVGSHRSRVDFKEVVKTASVKSLGNGVEIDINLQEHLRRSVSKIGSKNLPKSCRPSNGEDRRRQGLRIWRRRWHSS